MIDFIQLVLDLAKPIKSDRINAVLRQLSHIERPVIQKGINSSIGYITNYVWPAKVETGKVVISAHYDVVCGLGYNDNASGMAIATQLLKDGGLPDNVEVVFTDFEEKCGKGANLYCSNIESPGSVIANLNLDVVGLPGKVFYELYNPTSIYSLNLLQEGLERTYSIPFNDAHIFSKFNIPSVLLLTGTSDSLLVEDIFDVQHGGRFDDNINMLCNKTMNNVYSIIRKMIVTFDENGYFIEHTANRAKFDLDYRWKTRQKLKLDEWFNYDYK